MNQFFYQFYLGEILKLFQNHFTTTSMFVSNSSADVYDQNDSGQPVVIYESW